MIFSVVHFAREIIKMSNELENLRYENEQLREYKKENEEALKRSYANSNKIHGNLLKVLMTKGVAEAIQENKEAFAEQFKEDEKSEI